MILIEDKDYKVKYAEDVRDFVEYNDLQEEFKQLTGHTVEEYENDEDDETLIIKLLNATQPKRTFIVRYHAEGNGYFEIIQLKVK